MDPNSNQVYPSAKSVLIPQFRVSTNSVPSTSPGRGLTRYLKAQPPSPGDWGWERGISRARRGHGWESTCKCQKTVHAHLPHARPASARPDQGVWEGRGQKLLADPYQTSRPPRSLLLQSSLTPRCEIKIKLAQNPGPCSRSHRNLCPQGPGSSALRSTPAFPQVSSPAGPALQRLCTEPEP